MKFGYFRRDFGQGEPRQPVSLVSWADKRNYRSLKGQNDPLLMESSCYGERVVRNYFAAIPDGQGS